jgi:hypothetical protein
MLQDRKPFAGTHQHFVSSSVQVQDFSVGTGIIRGLDVNLVNLTEIGEEVVSFILVSMIHLHDVNTNS